MIVVRCPCGHVLRASDSFRGTKVTCAGCGKAVLIQDVPGQTDLEEMPGQQTAQAPRRPRFLLVLVLLVGLLAASLACWAVCSRLGIEPVLRLPRPASSPDQTPS
jgi:hypothetical protein